MCLKPKSLGAARLGVKEISSVTDLLSVLLVGEE